MRKFTITIVCVLSLLCAAAAQVPQPTPMPRTFVHDFARVLSADGKAKLQAGAERLKREYKTEIAIVTINSLRGEDSYDYSVRMARSWGIGSKENGVRGLLILVAVKDRKMAFRTSRDIEGELPDALAAEINREMGAYFKKGDFNGGLAHGMDRILERVQAASQPKPQPQPTPVRVASSVKNSRGGLVWPWVLIAAIVVGSLLLHRLGHARDRYGWGGSSGTTGYSPHESTGLYASSGFGYDSGSSGSSDYGSSSSSDYSSSSSSDSSSSGGDSGSGYSGGSDFGSGGSDSSW